MWCKSAPPRCPGRSRTRWCLMAHILAIDQGTTPPAPSCSGTIVPWHPSPSSYTPQYFPRSGTRAVSRWLAMPIAAMPIAARPAPALRPVARTACQMSYGLCATQRDRVTGKPIVWQDRRTAPTARRRRPDGAEAQVAAPTACCSTPIFPPPRSRRCPTRRPTRRTGVRHRGFVPAVGADDRRVRRRTIRYDANAWSDVCVLSGVPKAMPSDVRDCAAEYGATAPGVVRRRHSHPRHRRRPRKRPL
jgi:glycerol kinase